MEPERIGKIVPGAVYVFHQLRPSRVDGQTVFVDTPLGLYQVLGLAVAWPQLQEVVVYFGLDGQDKDRLFTCTPWDFVIKFRPATPEQPADPEPPEKAAGYATQSRW